MLPLTEVLRLQNELNERMGYPMGEKEDGDGSTAIKENMLALIVEATEVLGEINWKRWKDTAKEVDRSKLALELIDVLQFWANAVNAAGFTAEEIGLAYHQKYEECNLRIERGEVTNV